MSYTLARFDELPWLAGSHPLEQKKVGEGGLTLLSFEPGFSDPNWCERSHVFFVLVGTLYLELDGETIALGAGQSLSLERGTRHRASVRGGPAVTVFVASDLAPGGA